MSHAAHVVQAIELGRQPPAHLHTMRKITCIQLRSTSQTKDQHQMCHAAHFKFTGSRSAARKARTATNPQKPYEICDYVRNELTWLELGVLGQLSHCGEKQARGPGGRADRELVAMSKVAQVSPTKLEHLLKHMMCTRASRGPPVGAATSMLRVKTRK